MKLCCVLFLVLSVAATCLASHRGADDPRFVFLHDETGKVHLVDLDDETPTVKFVPDHDIGYHLYTRTDSKTPVRIYKGDAAGLAASSFNVNHPVKVTIHGWTGDLTSGINTNVSAAFLKAMDANIFAIDWSKGSSGGYGESVKNVAPAGESIGQFLDWLNILGVSFSDMHIMGHSLGGQLAGFSSRLATRGTAEIVTGLDPAGPNWNADSDRIRQSDAKYLEIIHTNSGQLGMKDAVGHNDFYANDGVNMPGCSGNFYCSHKRAWAYMADSIDHEGFLGSLCPSVTEVLTGECNYLNTKLHMGGSRVKPSVGIFGLKTNAEEPYYQG